TSSYLFPWVWCHGADLSVEHVSNLLGQFESAVLTPKTHKDQLRMFAQRVIPDRDDIDALSPEGLEEYFESVSGLDEFSLGQGAIIRARERQPCAHPHLSFDHFVF